MWEHYFKGDNSSIWNWAKNHMWHKSGSWDGYFAWKRGETGANAVATYALMNNTKYAEAVKKNLQMAWDAKPMTGQPGALPLHAPPVRKLQDLEAEAGNHG